MKEFFKQLIQFVKDVAGDQRIPDRDKKMILALLALIISPIDLIPDWIPIIGMLDDLVLIALILDYFFNVLDEQILLGHYPWGMKSYTRIKRGARFIALLTPGFLKDRLWKFRPTPYR